MASAIYITSGTAAATGADFPLQASTSRLFYCKPALGSSESLTLDIKNVDGTYTQVGALASARSQTGTVTATGAGSSTFRVRRSTVSPAKVVYFD